MMTQSRTNASKSKKNPSDTVSNDETTRTADQRKPVLRELLPTTMFRETRNGDSTLPMQDDMGKPKRSRRGRRGYDCGKSSEERTGPLISNRHELSLALALPPFHEIDNGFVIPSVFNEKDSNVHSNKNEGATTIYYHLIGDPYKRDSNIEGAASLLVPAQLLGLVEDLHEKSAERALMTEKICRALWDQYSRRTTSQAAAACWREECIAEDTTDGRSELHTKASLLVKDEDGKGYSPVGPAHHIFPGTPKSALRRRWRTSEARRTQDDTPHQSSSGTA
jgi:hypothetical protein